MWQFLDAHAGAIQAICAVLALVLGFAGAFLLFHTLKVNRAQALAASEQFAIAQKQFGEALRPIIVVSMGESPQQSLDDNVLSLTLTNDGMGPALNMDGLYTQTTTLLGSKSSCVVAVLTENPEEASVLVQYESLDGRRFETLVTIYNRGNCINKYREVERV